MGSLSRKLLVALFCLLLAASSTEAFTRLVAYAKDDGEAGATLKGVTRGCSPLWSDETLVIHGIQYCDPREAAGAGAGTPLLPSPCDDPEACWGAEVDAQPEVTECRADGSGDFATVETPGDDAHLCFQAPLTGSAGELPATGSAQRGREPLG